MPKQYNIETMTRSRGLVVKAEDSQPRGCWFKSDAKLNGYKKY